MSEEKLFQLLETATEKRILHRTDALSRQIQQQQLKLQNKRAFSGSGILPRALSGQVARRPDPHHGPSGHHRSTGLCQVLQLKYFIL